MPVPLPARLAGGKTYNRFGHLLVITDDDCRLIAVGVIGKDDQAVHVSMVGDETITLRARWECAPPKVGDYLMAQMWPQCSYRILERRVTGHTNDHTRLELRVVRVPLPVPAGSVVHPWKWDLRAHNAGHKTAVDGKLVRALVPRHLDVLRSLVKFGGWARPLDVGATSCSFHHSTLSRLVGKGLAERRLRARDSKLPADRPSYEYRATNLGVEHAR